MLLFHMIRALWHHMLDGLVAYGAFATGYGEIYTEWTDYKSTVSTGNSRWDWSTPHQWYADAHPQ